MALTLEKPVHLRPYAPADLPALVALDDLCFAPEFRFSGAAMRGFVQAPNAVTTVAVSGDQIVGFGILHVERPGGYLITLDVHPSFRRGGVASRLVSAMERHARRANCAALVLHVFTGNAPALAFYARMGFKGVHRAPAFYGPGLDAEVLRKLVAPEPMSPGGGS